MKYSINGTGNIVAERDIYSLGGFIPKGTVGGKIASESQLSQDGECWLVGGDISDRPDIVIKDNAYVGDFEKATGMHKDGVTEFSGNTLIPGKIIVRKPIDTPVSNFYAKDSFIGVSMDVLCGPSTTATAFPFKQGGFNKDVPAGTLFTSASMHTSDANICRTTANLRLGKDTYIYVPTGYNCRVFWGYRNTAGQLAYSGESFAVSRALTKLEHPTYKMAMVHIAKANGTAMTPANLLATGAKILGHISNSLLMDIRPESASGQYVMDKSSILMNTDNYGLATTQMRLLAGSMYDTTMYTKTDRSDYKLYGTFRNVERLEYTKYISDSYRTAATRDTYISAYDCPLLRVDNTTYDDSLAAKGDLTLRRCIVPKAEFLNDIINGNTFEDIDFSYANEDLGFTMAGYTRFISSNKQGIYRLSGGPSSTGFASHKGNLADTARLYQAEVYLPLDADLVESGSYSALPGTDYEDAKIAASNRVRMARPLATLGVVFPSMPTGYAVDAIIYLDSSFISTSVVSNPTSISTDYPYFILVFRKEDGNTPLPVNGFIALNTTLRIIDHTKAPEITGSAYVGAGCTVRGDVKLIGDPYVNRLLDVNMWERGTASQSVGKSWEDSKISTTLGNRFRLMDTFPVDPGGLITCNSGYWVECGFFDSNGIFISSPGWGRTSNYVPAGAAYAGIIIKKAASASELGGLIEDSDIPLANVKYLRAFKKRRYITNELDRTSPEDILLGPDFFEQGNLALTAGGYYELAKRGDVNHLLFKRLLNVGRESTSTVNSTYVITKYAFDAITRFIAGGENLENRALAGNLIRKEPESAITPDGISFTRMVIEFTPSPRIIVPYGSATLFISGPKIRMYDNAVLSRNLNQEGGIVLQGDAVMGYDFNSGSCMCSNGHSDAIIKLP
jgi:hypothetical protein